MSGFGTNQTEHLKRSQLWSAQLKEVLEDELLGMRWVDMISDFPDGDTLNIPSIGQAQALDYAEGQAVKYNAFDTGNFQFTINEYKQVGTYIYNKYKQDSFYMSKIVSSFVPKMTRAIMKSMEIDMLEVGPNGQTADDTNSINGAYHRFVAGGTGQVIQLEDFAKARYALKQANVPDRALIAIVDPSVEYELNTLTNLTNVSNNAQWEGIITTGIASDMRFIRNIYGFDVYVSQNLKKGLSETIDTVAVTNGVANLFFSADSSVLPIVGQVRQAPMVDSEYNKDLQRDEYVVTARYGFALFRPENMVVVISDNSRVYS